MHSEHSTADIRSSAEQERQ